ncbi:MAG: hypothetical protein HOV97_05530 [Nonomuraea sp.]|nr:hypothetical protein [Nonomuraea sp.]
MSKTFDRFDRFTFRDTEHEARVERVAQAFDRDALRRICEMSEADFAAEFTMTTTEVAQEAPANFYHFRDNGSNVLAVAHLDTVGLAHQRTAHFVQTEGGEVIFSRALDDRLGAYVILHLLPALGITHDFLLTVGEESGESTAAFFMPPEGKDYEWMIEFDRGGTDVVMYQYEDQETIDLVRDAGARVGNGSFSDICYLEHLEVKGFNWGVGYRDYHGPRAHAFLDDTFTMVARYLAFHEENAGTYLPHDAEDNWGSMGLSRYWAMIDDDEDYADTNLDDVIDNPTSEQLEALDRALEGHGTR